MSVHMCDMRVHVEFRGQTELSSSGASHHIFNPSFLILQTSPTPSPPPTLPDLPSPSIHSSETVRLPWRVNKI